MATGVSKTKWRRDVLDQDDVNRSPLELHYAGKLSEQAILRTAGGRFSTLYQGGSHNRLYFSDNLPVLAALRADAKIAGKVELIYIDPPFATGGVFQSRRQNDAYTDLLKGAAYIEFIRQRLLFLRELLSETGSIYVHLDANMIFAVKLIMDEVFGEGNFRNLITRKKCNPKNYTRKRFGNISDQILFYTKTDTYTWNRPFEPWTPQAAEKEYPYIDEQTGRRYKKVPVHAPGTRNGETGKPWRGMMPPPGKHWQYTPDKLDEMDRRGEIYWSPTGNPRRKIFYDESPGKPVQDIWLDAKDAHNQNIRVTGYPTEKNALLLERIIQASSNPGDLVIDCFSGSGTTLAVSQQLSRRWVGIDNSPHAIATTLRRFAQGAEMMGDFVTDRKPPSSSRQLSLFNTPESVTEAELPNIESSHHPVTDFVLYCEAKVQDLLEDETYRWIQVLDALRVTT